MKAISILSLLVALASLGVALWVVSSQPKIGYVHNDRLFAEYNGVKEGSGMYQDKVRAWQANLDTLQNGFNAEAMTYEQNKAKMGARERQLTEELLGKKQAEVMRYRDEIEKMASDAQAQLSVEIVNQVNSFLQEYGKANGYDYVFGVTDNGSLHLAPEGKDLTAEVLKQLNSKYEGK